MIEFKRGGVKITSFFKTTIKFMFRLLFILLLLPNLVYSQSFYLDDNGITIKCEKAEIGDKGIVDGVTYVKRTIEQITPQNVSTTCTSEITTTSRLFKNNINFNGYISHWDVSNVVNMKEMFFDAFEFNGDLSKWDVSNVENMDRMFWRATSFDGDISEWDVSSLKSMNEMFALTQYNGDLSKWDVSKVRFFRYTFYGNQTFNSDLSKWDLSSAEDTGGMFRYSESFNSDVSNWNVSRVRYMDRMFEDTFSFKSDLSKWCVYLIEEPPTNFSNLDEDLLPNWGSCDTNTSALIRENKKFSFSIYPNPFNSSFNISYNLERYSDVNIELYDMNGRLVKTVVNKSQSMGQYDIFVELNELSSKVYICVLNVNGNIYTNKLFLVK